MQFVYINNVEHYKAFRYFWFSTLWKQKQDLGHTVNLLPPLEKIVVENIKERGWSALYISEPCVDTWLKENCNLDFIQKHYESNISL